MIIYSLQDAAKYFGCSKKTVQRMVEHGEMPEPIREEKDAGGKIWRIWDSSDLEEIKKKVEARRKHSPLVSLKVSTKVDNAKKKTSHKTIDKSSS
jgi:excisionase family DNA binding protein